MILKVVFPESIRHLNGRADNESIPFKEWLLLHLSNSLGHISPRDIIAFLSKCIDNEMGTVQAGKKIYFPILLEGSIVSAYNELSKEKFEDVIAVTGLSDIPNYLNAKCMRSFTYKKLKDMLEVDDNDEEKFTKQLNVLVSVGFIRMNTMQAFGKHYYVTYEVPPLYTANWKQPKGKVKAA